MTDDVALGVRVRDTVTGYEGTVTAVADHISQCSTATVERGSQKVTQMEEVNVDRLEPLGSLHDGKAVETDVDEIPDDISLGAIVRDPKTGFQGYVVMTSEYLFEAPKVLVRPDELGDGGTYPDSQWLHTFEVDIVDADGYGGDFDDRLDRAETDSPGSSNTNIMSVTDHQA